MTHLKGDARVRYVREMFSQIADRYDLMNRLMTAWQDVRWRREVIARARLSAGDTLLDLGTGTGDLAREALRQVPGIRVVAADFTLTMMRVGQERYGKLPWVGADALRLPFAEAQFDAVVSGFLMRNVIDVPMALREQYRVLKPSGRMVILDTTPPHRNLLWPFIWLHLHVVIPTLGGLIAGRRDAYTYLPDSTENFLTAESLAERMHQAGFVNVAFRRRMFGTIAIHWGEKHAD
ncbi:MAG: ubiquinone/menaquinone biosynthesis methyltransferase [Anaerolineales bacterium]